jgi:NADH-quinone oxidoreductase subunit B
MSGAKAPWNGNKKTVFGSWFLVFGAHSQAFSKNQKRKTQNCFWSICMGIEEHLGYNVLTTTLEKLVDWSRKSSLWPATFGLACCAIEMIVTAANRWDIARFGMEAFRASPRQADVIIIAGTVCKKMMPAIERVYEQMSEPKWVIAMGACASSGGIFDSYAVVQGIDKYLPVDVYVPGCPPRPEGLLYGILKLHEKILQDPFLTKQYRDKLQARREAA